MTLSDPGNLHALLQRNGVSFDTGVPDSIIASFCWFLRDNPSPTDTKDGVVFVNARLAAGHRSNPGRPTLSPRQANTAVKKWLT